MIIRSTVLAAASAALAALAALAGPAVAGSLDVVAATPAPAVPVAAAPVMAQAARGDWTGGYAGAQLSYGTAESEDLFGDEEADGALFGVNSGYRYDFGRIVLGGEVSYDGTSVTLPDDTDVNGVLRAGVTAGYDVGRILPYVTAGYAGTGIENDDLDIDEELDGGYYGIGAAFQLTDRIMVGAEVLRHRFEVNFNGLDEDADLTTFGVKAAFRF